MSDQPTFSGSGGPPLRWADGLCRIHCRDDRCCFGCSCPGHQEDGTHVPQGPPLDSLRAALVGPSVRLDELDDRAAALFTALIELVGKLNDRIAEVDERTVDVLTRIAEAHNALSDRVAMLELDRKGDQR